MPHPIFVFDAYGTLFDVHSAVGRHAASIGPMAPRLSELWRSKQLEYTWVRTLAGAYHDFRACTEAALDYAASEIGGIAPPLREALLAAYDRLDAYPDVVFDAILESSSPVAAAGLDSPVRTFTTRFRIQQQDPRLLPDLSASLEISLPRPVTAPEIAKKAKP